MEATIHDMTEHRPAADGGCALYVPTDPHLSSCSSIPEIKAKGP
jgi:hypothetical protein